MAWTAPRTWVTSEVVSATIMNAHVRDNLLETAPAKASAKGDLFAATGANAISRLAIGTNGYSLVPNSSCNVGVMWSSMFTNNTTTGCLRTVVTSDVGFVHNGTDYAAGASTVSSIIWANSGYGAWLRYIEFPNNRWMMGCIPSDSNLTFATGYPGASTYRFTLSSTGAIVANGNVTGPQLDLRNTNVAHGITAFGAHTSTYGYLGHYDGANGGLSTWGMTQSGTVGLNPIGTATSADTAKSTGAMAPIWAQSTLKSGTGVTTVSTNGNLMVLANYTTARFIFDAEGDLHADAAVSASAYDLWDDAHLARALMTEIGGKHIVKNEFDGFLKYNRQHLQDLGVATFNDGPEGDGSVFVNWMQMSRVLAGAAWQLSSCIMRLERDVESRLADLTGRLDGMTRVLGSASGLQEYGSSA